MNLKLKDHEYTAQWNDVKFKGIRSLFINNLTIISKSGTNEVRIDSLNVKVRLVPLIFQHVNLKKIQCQSLYIKIVSVDQDSSIEKIDKKDSKGHEISKVISEKNWAEFVSKNSRRFFKYIPSKLYFGKAGIQITYSNHISKIEFHNIKLWGGELTASIELADSITVMQIPCRGSINRSSSSLEFLAVNKDTSLFPLPILEDKFGLRTGFDSLRLAIHFSDRNRELVKADGEFGFSRFKLQGKRISTDNIQIDRFNSQFHIYLAENSVEADSSTWVQLNKLVFHPYLKFTKYPEPEATFKIIPVTWNAGNFFASLPQGMFTSLSGLKATGTLHYYLNFYVNFNKVDSLVFDTRLTADDFKIEKYGTDDYRIINGSFQHRVYEKGRMVSSFIVGPENPDFTPFEQISPYLRAAVMTSEDGSFFYHRGFNPDAFRESMATNIKEKRFARGGSTISMQLVKNVFLTRNKTLARKIEEALIVWLIENEHLVSKQRMYEIYLNIIEWGPGIYGAANASRFYFDKAPSALSLSESIYMASIVPRPKWYKYTFESNGILRSFYDNYFSRMKELMVRKQFIPSVDTIGLQPDVLLTGKSAAVFSSVDSLGIDTLVIPDLYLTPVF